MPAKLSYAVEQRMRMIDYLAFHFGTVSRKHIMDYFGIGPASSTRDFKLYQELAPDNLLFNDSAKAYDKSSSFKRLYP